MKILVTGGTGYIGSHTIVELIQNGYDITIYDNLTNSSFDVLNKVHKITNTNVDFVEGDICDVVKLNKIFNKKKIEGVFHFAGLKAVAESEAKPHLYYENNVIGTIQLLKVMKNHNIKMLVFSSSATVYGNPINLPIKEDVNLEFPKNPYAKTKFIIENILSDLFLSDNTWRIVILRYFNPVGAHPSGLIGENPRGVPNNLMPCITQTAIGRQKFLSIYGNDYPTFDGSAVRDYIHVTDLAKGHLAAINFSKDNDGLFKFNLGTGIGYSVIQILETFKRVNSLDIPYTFVGRRPGDIAECYANVELAKNCLGWEAKLGLEEMCRDSWNYQLNNPDGC